MKDILQQKNERPEIDSAVDLDWEALPGGLRELKGVVGPGAALAVCSVWGGRTLYIPAIAHPDHPLTRILGVETANRLCRAMAGDRLSVPKIDAVSRQIRAHRIKKRRSRGDSISELAGDFGLTPRRILQILEEDQAA